MILIKVRTRAAYGKVLLDPANSAAHHLAAIAGLKTLTIEVLSHALRMGCQIAVDEPGNNIGEQIAAHARLYADRVTA